MAASPTIQIPQFAIVDVDSSRPQTPVPLSNAESSAPTSPATPRKDTLKVEVPMRWRRRRSSSVSTMDTLPIYSEPSSPIRGFRGHKRSNSMAPSVCSEAPSYRTIPDDHDSTTYHIYRLGKKGSISIHEVPDKSLGALPRATFADGTPRPLPGFWARNCRVANPKTSRRPDCPKFDPRMPSYFVHKPVIPTLFKHVPMTLRVGPNKHSPIACRFDHSMAFGKWTFDFEDINGEGVVDERGVIAEHFPRRRKMAKTSSAPAIITSETKKPTEKLDEAASPAPLPVINVTEETTPNTQKKDELPDTAEPQPAAASSTRGAPPALKIDTSNTNLPFPPSTPKSAGTSDKVEMVWENKLGRQYSFSYKDIKFSWKGTSTLKDEHNKHWGSFNKYSHLKLVAELPEDPVESPKTPKTPKSPCLSPDDAEKPGFLLRRRSSISSISSIFSKKSVTSKKELVVATYTCTMGRRKAGRLHVDNTAIEKLVEIIAANSPTSFSPVPRRRSSSFSGEQYLSPVSLSPPTKRHHAHVFPTPSIPEFPVEVEVFDRKRLRELVVVTCVAMSNAEQEKRHALVELTFLAVEIVQNVVTS
ncbi:hypothetical protein H072_3093 [Dactylellina haptotyla CBS 200.50]|uniref:Uncharacterized protein n=1 Tax=Dactylellina haptotyla (strain CBS 200.50) TaxID=1284197 RepID=S8C5I9_DACHA|nr:hypothetical protein H072_3093 [Dactylellina haptotyla CBS 200.50]